MLNPAQYRSASPGAQTGTLRQFTGMDFRLFYSDNTQTYGQNQPALAGPPTFANVRAEVQGADIVFSANAVGDPSAGMQSVWVTYTDGSQPAGTWVSLDLTQSDTDSTLWTGRLAGAATSFGRLDYMIQAVNGVGLVTLDDNYGSYFHLLSGPVNRDGTPAAPQATSALLLAAPAAASYGDAVTASATLTSGGQPVPGARVVFSMGGSGRVGTTGADGVATVTFPVTANPGAYTITAAFTATAALAGSSASSSIEVGKAATFVSAASAGSDVTATLVDAVGSPLIDRTVYFTRTGPGGTVTVPVLTDNVGVARLGTAGLGDGAYTVTVRFLGPIPTATGTELKDDPVYLPSSASVAISIDRTGPTITFSGATSYEVDQTVSITCSATDASGVAATS